MKSSLTSSASLAAVLGLAALSSARHCQNITVQVPVDSRNAVFNRTAPATNIDVTNFVLDLTRQGHNLTNEVLTGVSERCSQRYLSVVLISFAVRQYQEYLQRCGDIL